MAEIAKLGRTVDNAAHKARAIRQLSENTKYTLDDAYDVQAASIQRRLDRGEKRNGMKMGFTSRAKMIQMGLNDMIWGRLTDQMLVEDGDTILFDEQNRKLELEVSDEEIQTRLAAWKPPEPKFKRGVMAKYARLVSSAAQGAVTN